MINSIKFIKGQWFLFEKESQKRFRTKTIKPNRYSREKNSYKIFYLFDKGATINFKDKVNVMVGENGSGKSSLIHIIKNYAGKPLQKSGMVFSESKNDEEYFHEFLKKRDSEEKEIKIVGDISYKNSIFFDAEKDNPVVAIPHMLNPDSKSFPGMVNQLFTSQEESHGESMLPILDYILENTKNCTIFMDEPETALSLKNQIKITKKIIESSEQRNNQIILSTHSLMVIKQFDEVFDMESRNWISTKKYLDSIEK